MWAHHPVRNCSTPPWRPSGPCWRAAAACSWGSPVRPRRASRRSRSPWPRRSRPSWAGTARSPYPWMGFICPMWSLNGSGWHIARARRRRSTRPGSCTCSGGSGSGGELGLRAELQPHAQRVDRQRHPGLPADPADRDRGQLPAARRGRVGPACDRCWTWSSTWTRRRRPGSASLLRRQRPRGLDPESARDWVERSDGGQRGRHRGHPGQRRSGAHPPRAARRGRSEPAATELAAEPPQ